jgi:hypothetical protein
MLPVYKTVEKDGVPHTDVRVTYYLNFGNSKVSYSLILVVAVDDDGGCYRLLHQTIIHFVHSDFRIYLV